MGVTQKVLLNNRKKTILRAAQKVFSKNGVDSSIRNIALKANIAESAIYHYFKNKEDLLFSATANILIEAEKKLKSQLEGILEPVSKLGKMIWYHIYYINDLSLWEDRNITTLVFECRANNNFYSHEGYQSLREYTKIMTKILKEGVQKKIFRNDLNIALVRDVILGLLDEELLNFLNTQETKKELPDLLCILNIVLPIITKKDRLSTKENTEKRILMAALNLFNQKGYNGTTLSEIAAIANVAQGTIYLYFKNKNELFFSIVRKQFNLHRYISGDVFNLKCPIQKFHLCMRLAFVTSVQNRNLLKVFLLNTKLKKEFHIQSINKHFYQSFSFLGEILEEGKELGIFIKSIDEMMFRNLFIGSITHLLIRRFLLKNDDLMNIAQDYKELYRMLCRSILTEKGALCKSARNNYPPLS